MEESGVLVEVMIEARVWERVECVDVIVEARAWERVECGVVMVEAGVWESEKSHELSRTNTNFLLFVHDSYWLYAYS